MSTVAILGSTGSIGRSTCAVLDALPGRFRVTSLAAGRNIDLLIRQVRRFDPQTVAVKSPESAERLAALFPKKRIVWGREGLLQAVSDPRPDSVVAAIDGTDSLEAIFAALEQKARICLANKECLVAAGSLVNRIRARSGAQILPVDSEQSALFQALGSHPGSEVKRLVLTASGGPFLRLAKERLASVTPEQALAHPVWSMGRKITVDSATLMNKALEVIEAHYLFQIEPERIGVLVHPQSIIHSMVEFVDGVLLAQLSVPDMKIPIQYALTHPQRLPRPEPGVDFVGQKSLEFLAVDEDRFPALRLARQVLAAGGTAGAVFNAANEVAVDLFLKEKIGFAQIYSLVERTLSRADFIEPQSLEAVLDTIAETRKTALELAGGE